MSLLDEIHKKSTNPLIIRQYCKGECVLFWEFRSPQLCRVSIDFQGRASPLHGSISQVKSRSGPSPSPLLSVAGECVNGCWCTIIDALGCPAVETRTVAWTLAFEGRMNASRIALSALYALLLAMKTHRFHHTSIAVVARL